MHGCIVGKLPLISRVRMTPDVQPSRPSRRFGLVIVGFWILFTIVALPVTAIGMWIKTGTVDLVNQVIWESGWIGWAPLSFVVLRLCRRFPLDRQQLWKSIARLAGIGVGVVALQLLLECLINTALGMWLRDYQFDWKRLFYVATYKAHAYYAIYWMVVGAAHAVEFHRRFRESELISSQLEAKLANAELERLKTQLQPHFLFNTHNTIVALMLKNDNKTAVRMLTRLSDLLRVSLSRSGQQLVTLREELETLRLYLEIQQERFRDRLSMEIVTPAELEKAEVPHLLLQPLVENALIHGLDSAAENARLELRFNREADTLVCEIQDNGAGFAAEPSAGKADDTEGIGLSNTRERLQQLYGSRQSLAIKSSPGNGCTVVLRLPFRLRTGTALATTR